MNCGHTDSGLVSGLHLAAIKVEALVQLIQYGSASSMDAEMLKRQMETWLMLLNVEAENVAVTNEPANRNVSKNRYRKVVLEVIAGYVHKILVCIIAVAVVSANACSELAF